MGLDKYELYKDSDVFSGAKSILRLSIIAGLFFLSACQTAPTSPGGSSSPSIPSSGGSSGSPSPEDSSSQESSSSSESETGESSDPESSSESESDSETAPDWEEDSAAEGGADGAAEDEGEVSFEEAEAEGSASDSDDVSFEEPDFAEDGGLTEQEIEELEKELNESLGDFDEEIQREKTFAEERANDNAGDESLGGVGVFESYEEEQENNSENGKSSASASSESASSASAESASSAEADGSESSNAGTVTGDEVIKGEAVNEETDEVVDLPPDVPDNIETDDIVARQIREAAENEVDPELKEKLWAEYRKYKNQ